MMGLKPVLGPILGRVAGSPRVPQTIPCPASNTITHPSHKPNMMLFSAPARNRALSVHPAGLQRAHFRAQGIDEVLDMQRQRGATLYRDIGFEPCRLGDPDQLDAGIAA